MGSPAAAPAAAMPPAEHEDDGQDQSLHHKENAKVPWSEGVWKAIHRNVHDETMRVRVGAKFLPHPPRPPQNHERTAGHDRESATAGRTKFDADCR